MPTYFFSFEGKPTSAAPRATDIKAGLVNVFVVAPSIAEAEIRAREHVMEYAWVITAVEHALEPQPDQISRCDPGIVALHRKALRDGLASEFITWPKAEGRDADPVEIRSMGPPPTLGRG